MELDLEDASGTKKQPLSPGVRMLVISIGFMTDAYDLFVIGIVLVIIRRLYGENTTAEALLATAVLIGTKFRRQFCPSARETKNYLFRKKNKYQSSKVCNVKYRRHNDWPAILRSDGRQDWSSQNVYYHAHYHHGHGFHVRICIPRESVRTSTTTSYYFICMSALQLSSVLYYVHDQY